MGAVAALLHSLKTNRSVDDIANSPVKSLVLDSPFCDFRQIAKTIGT